MIWSMFFNTERKKIEDSVCKSNKILEDVATNIIICKQRYLIPWWVLKKLFKLVILLILDYDIFLNIRFSMKNRVLFVVKNKNYSKIDDKMLAVYFESPICSVPGSVSLANLG